MIEVSTTVTAAPSTVALTTAARAASYIGNGCTATDAVLLLMLPQASEAVANYCNRVFAAQTQTDSFRLDRRPRGGGVIGGVRALMLTQWPVASVASVTETIAGTATTLVSGTDFELDAAPGMLYRLDTWGQRRDWLAERTDAAYSGGYTLPTDSDTGTLPATVERAALETLKAWWLARNREAALRSEAVPQVLSAAYVPAGPWSLPPEATALLDGKYRRPCI